MKMWVNGITTDKITINDRGLQFGDGLFETMLVENGKPQDLHLHLYRMKAGCKVLRIPFPDNWHKEIEKLCHDNGILKLILTRGNSQQGLAIPENINPNRIIKITQLPKHIKKYQKSGVNLKICNTKLSSNNCLSGLKTINHLEYILAHLELSFEYQECLILNAKNEIIEGTNSNFFGIKNDILFTPNLDKYGIPGIIRDKVFKIAKELKITTKIVKMTDYKNFNSCFITNSVIGLYPVVKINNNSYKICDKVREIQKKLLGNEK